MERAELVKTISSELSVDTAEAGRIVNEILAIRVVPDVFRNAAVKRIASMSRVDATKAEVAINQFVGQLTERPSLFEAVVSGFTAAAGVDDSCRSCDGCRNCGAEAFLEGTVLQA